MHGCGPENDESWGRFRQRREEWRAQRKARHAQRRAEWAEHWGAWGLDPAYWGGATGMGAGPSPGVDELKAQVADMQKTIDKLLNRVAVLEKLAVDGDETRLAAEIEKLRDKGSE